MITGRSSGSGKYSYQETHSGNTSVMASHMPDDGYSVRIVFRHNGESSIPIIKVSTREAELLWATLNKMAAELKWDDRMPIEITEAKASETGK